MDPITLVGDAMRALTFKAIDLHVSYVADDITIEELYAGSTPPRVIRGKDAYRDHIGLLATLPDGEGITSFEVVPTGPPGEADPTWVRVVLHVRSVIRGAPRGHDIDEATSDWLVAVHNDRIQTIRTFPQHPKVYRYP